MPRAKKTSPRIKNGHAAASESREDGFINVAVDRETRAGLHYLKEAMQVPGQAEVIAKLVAIGVAIHSAVKS